MSWSRGLSVDSTPLEVSRTLFLSKRERKSHLFSSALYFSKILVLMVSSILVVSSK